MECSGDQRAEISFRWGYASGICHRGLTVDPNDGQQLECNDCSVAEGVIRRIVDDGADFVSRCATTFFQQTAFMCPHLETTGWRQWPSCAFGGTALLALITANGLWSPVTTSSLYEPPWSFAEYLTESGVVHNNADILIARDGTTLPEGLRASTSGLDLGVVTKTRFDMGGCASGSRHCDWLTDPSMTRNLTAPSS